MSRLTHLDATGQAMMVDVSDKAITHRTARAGARVLMARETVLLIQGGLAKKGDVLAVARVAGIMAAKKTADLIPLCHPLMLSSVTVDFTAGDTWYDVEARVLLDGKTGVEMEALTACSVACLTLYDMCKAVDRAMRITDLRVIEKDGGKSGRYEEAPPWLS